MRKANVIFDWDGVFTEQTEFLCKMFCIPVPDRYNVYEATNITRAEADILTNAWNSEKGYLDVPFVEGVARALNLPCVPYIYSGNTTEEMAHYKYNMAQVYNPLLPDDHIILPIALHKPPLPGADIVVEDSIANLLQYPGTTVKLLIDKPYNQDAPKEIVRVSSLMAAVDLIEYILRD